MFKVKIFSVGKTKETWLNTALEEYLKRLQKSMKIEWIFVKNDDELRKTLGTERHFIALDPGGISIDSVRFSTFFYKNLEKQGSRLNFVIGGAEGIPKDILEEASELLSFSKMTFTHQMIRLLLIEQIYRAHMIRAGSDYHK